jgi:molybdopterin converting factor small subunit
MKVRLRLFALARDLVGSPALEVELPNGSAIADLRQAMSELAPAIVPVAKSAMFAVSAQYVSNEFILKDGDEVACIAPVSGG